MPSSFSFDVVSDFDHQELVNAVDQLKREISQRYDLKDSGTDISLDEKEITIITASDMTLNAIQDILRQKVTKRSLSIKIFDFQKPETSSGNKIKQLVILRRGLSKEYAKILSKEVKSKLKKINVSIQGESLRITGKSKDELQLAMKIIREKEEDLDIPLQFENYR